MNKKTQSEVVKPCPFCGGPAETDHYRGFVSYKGKAENAAAIYCTSCEADMCMCHTDFPQYTPEQLIAILSERWNKRVLLKTLTPAKFSKLHTPLTVTVGTSTHSATYIGVLDSHELTVAECYREAEANALVHAVNCHASLLEACKVLFGLVESGHLVRDIRKDGEADFALRQLPLVKALQQIESAISQAENHTQNL